MLSLLTIVFWAHEIRLRMVWGLGSQATTRMPKYQQQTACWRYTVWFQSMLEKPYFYSIMFQNVYKQNQGFLLISALPPSFIQTCLWLKGISPTPSPRLEERTALKASLTKALGSKHYYACWLWPWTFPIQFQYAHSWLFKWHKRSDSYCGLQARRAGKELAFVACMKPRVLATLPL